MKCYNLLETYTTIHQSIFFLRRLIYKKQIINIFNSAKDIRKQLMKIPFIHFLDFSAQTRLKKFNRLYRIFFACIVTIATMDSEILALGPGRDKNGFYAHKEEIHKL